MKRISGANLNSLQWNRTAGGSHLFVTRIADGNKVEFVFENINLPFADATNDGYVAFKIKTRPTLVNGDSFANSAGIYFDYNYPVLTNEASTIIGTLEVKDFAIGDYFIVFPNPANQLLNLKSKQELQVQSIAIYNTMGQLVLAIPNARNSESIDISQLKTGTYFLKISTDKGISNTKFLKK